MKKLMFCTLVFTLLGSALSANASQETRIQTDIYGADYRSAIYLANNEKYDEAYPKLLQLAKYGEKYPQFLVGMLLVSGQGTEADVATGLSWMRLALEQKHSDWQRKYDEVVSNYTPEQLATLEPVYEALKQKYGVDAQNVDCRYEKKMANSNYRVHVCSKTPAMRGRYYTVIEY